MRGEGCAGSPACPTAAVAAAGPVSPEPQKILVVAAAKAGRGRGGGSRGRRRGRRGAGEGEAREGMGLAARQRRHPAALARPCRRQPRPHSCPPLPSFPLGLGQLQVVLPTAPPRCSWHIPAGVQSKGPVDLGRAVPRGRGAPWLQCPTATVPQTSSLRAAHCPPTQTQPASSRAPVSPCLGPCMWECTGATCRFVPSLYRGPPGPHLPQPRRCVPLACAWGRAAPSPLPAPQ